jgi:hypothetical protein
MTLPVDEVPWKNSYSGKPAILILPKQYADVLRHFWRAFVMPSLLSSQVAITPDTTIFCNENGGREPAANFSKNIIAAGARILRRKFCSMDARRTLASAFAENMPDQLDRLAEPLGTSARVLRTNYGSTGLQRAQVATTIQAKACLVSKRANASTASMQDASMSAMTEVSTVSTSLRTQLHAADRDDNSNEKVDNDEGADPSSQLADRHVEPEAAQPSELASSSSQCAARWHLRRASGRRRPAKYRRDSWLP